MRSLTDPFVPKSAGRDRRLSGSEKNEERRLLCEC
jgi:hypothetical protein